MVRTCPRCCWGDAAVQGPEMSPWRRAWTLPASADPTAGGSEPAGGGARRTGLAAKRAERPWYPAAAQLFTSSRSIWARGRFFVSGTRLAK